MGIYCAKYYGRGMTAQCLEKNLNDKGKNERGEMDYEEIASKTGKKPLFGFSKCTIYAPLHFHMKPNFLVIVSCQFL